MQIKKIAQLLLEGLGQSVELEAVDAIKAIDSYDDECDRVEERLVTLVRKRAGIIPTQPGDSPQQRLNSLRLETAYPGVREARLNKIRLDNQTVISKLIGPLVTAMLNLEFAEVELEMEKARSERVRIAKSEHLRDGIYNDVAVAADRLHETYGATYHHWKALSDEQLWVIAQVLLGVPHRLRRES